MKFWFVICVGLGFGVMRMLDVGHKTGSFQVFRLLTGVARHAGRKSGWLISIKLHGSDCPAMYINSVAQLLLGMGVAVGWQVRSSWNRRTERCLFDSIDRCPYMLLPCARIPVGSSPSVSFGYVLLLVRCSAEVFSLWSSSSSLERLEAGSGLPPFQTGQPLT